MGRPTVVIVALAVVVTVTGACTQRQPSGPSAPTQQPNGTASPKSVAAGTDTARHSGGSSYSPPTTEEMAPLRPEYAAELAKVREPPEMVGKPLQVRKPVSGSIVKIGEVMNSVRAPEKATHEQRANAIRELADIADHGSPDDGVNREIVYGAIAGIACLDGANPQTVIGYASHAIASGGADSDSDDPALALRARMYLAAGEKAKALDDLEQIMMSGHGHAMAGGGVDPRKVSAPCEWSLPDFEALGADPRALAAKGLYLSAFVGFGAEDRKTVKASDIRDLYARAGSAWHSPIPHFLTVSLDGIGSEHSMAGVRCVRAINQVVAVPDLVEQCAKYDEGTRQQIRELTMALVIDPKYTPALEERADKYLNLAQGLQADNKPSRQFFDLAIKDYNAALASHGAHLHSLYCDRGLALASIGQYPAAAASYVEGMKYAKNDVEDSVFVYQQLAGLYMKLGQYSEAADVLTQAIIHGSGGGMNSVIFGGGIKAFRTLYPEYDLLPDEILAEVLRRRYQPQFPQSWDADFIAKNGSFNGKVLSSILPELYVRRGDAYLKAGRRADALADYARVKTDVWDGQEQYLPRHMFFTDDGKRNSALPEPWPPASPKM